MKKSLFTIALSLLTYSVFAQQEVKATIQYPDHTPGTFLDVYILSADEKVIATTATDEWGAFFIQITEGEYSLIVEEYGKPRYTQKLFVSQSVDLGLILLAKPEEVVLTEAVITTQKKLIEKKVDRLVFHADQAEGAKGGDALDLLKLAPRVKVENDIISMVGKNSLSVMVNDLLVDLKGEELSNYLKSIRAEDIEKIEVITNPPAKYISAGNSGLLNIVLKQGKRDSWNGNLSMSGYNRKKYGYNTNAAFNYRKDKWTVTTNFLIGESQWHSVGTTANYYSENRWKEVANWLGKSNFINARLGIDYEINEKLSTGFNVKFNQYKNDNHNKITTFVEDYPDYQLNNYFASTQDYKAKTHYSTFNYHVIYKPGNDHKLTFDFDWVNFNPKEEVSGTNRFFTKEHQEIDNQYSSNQRDKEQDAKNYIFNVDMEHPTKWVKLNYGGRLSLTTNKNDNKHFDTTTGIPIYDDDVSNRFNYDENISALYVSAEKKISEKWTAKAGLRYENTHAKGHSLENNTVDTYSYDGFFPTAYVSYTMDEKNTFSFNIGRRINRPYMGFLNPYRVYTTPYSYSEGNKDIQPSYAYNYELEHAYKDMFITTLYINDTRKEIEQVTILLPETNTQVWTPQNAYNSQSIGLSETMNFKPWRWWKATISLDASYAKIEGKIPAMNYAIEGWNFSSRFTNAFDLNQEKTWIANYTFAYTPKGVSGVNKFTATNQSHAGLSALFLEKKLQLSLNIYNLFKQDDAKNSSYSNQVLTEESFLARTTIRFGITYNFGKSFAIETSKSNAEEGRLK